MSWQLWQQTNNNKQTKQRNKTNCEGEPDGDRDGEAEGDKEGPKLGVVDGEDVGREEEEGGRGGERRAVNEWGEDSAQRANVCVRWLGLTGRWWNSETRGKEYAFIDSCHSVCV